MNTESIKEMIRNNKEFDKLTPSARESSVKMLFQRVSNSLYRALGSIIPRDKADEYVLLIRQSESKEITDHLYMFEKYVPDVDEYVMSCVASIMKNYTERKCY